MEVNFKPAENNDIDVLLSLIQKLYATHDTIQFKSDVVSGALMQLLGDESLGRVWLIEYQSKAIGYVILTLGYSLEYGGRDAFIDEFYIESAYQKQGIGKKTIQFLEEICLNLNVKALHLEVERGNNHAQGFYHRVGFKDHDRYLMTKYLDEV